MDVGIAFVFQNFEDQLSDTEAWERDLEVASWVEPLGFDYIGAVEHHFFNYAMLPDNFSFLAYMAGKTKNVKLMTAAVILPWNDPLRVTERLIELDHLSGGRVCFGMGRGLARREYDHFQIDMNEARDRFVESAHMIVEGLETGVVEGKGPYYKMGPIPVRPGPRGSFRDRTYCVAMSSDTVPIAVDLGATMMAFANKPWETMVEQVEGYRQSFEKTHGRMAPNPGFCNFMFCDESADRAAEMAHKHMGNYYDTVMQHYEMASDHWKNLKNYGDYAASAEAIAQLESYEAGRRAYVSVNDFGTPTQILEEYERRRGFLGDFDLFLNPTYGGLGLEDVRGSMNLFSKKVIPELRSWSNA